MVIRPLQLEAIDDINYLWTLERRIYLSTIHPHHLLPHLQQDGRPAKQTP